MQKTPPVWRGWGDDGCRQLLLFEVVVEMTVVLVETVELISELEVGLDVCSDYRDGAIPLVFPVFVADPDSCLTVSAGLEEPVGWRPIWWATFVIQFDRVLGELFPELVHGQDLKTFLVIFESCTHNLIRVICVILQG
jgi:hypothetical protein